METAFNFVWAILVAAGLVFWWRAESPEGRSKSAQLCALAMVALILFPVISVTDDFRAAQNPAEADSCLRRMDPAAHQHTIVPDTAGLPPGHEAEPSIALLGRVAMREEHVPAAPIPVPSFLFSRPPPSA